MLSLFCSFIISADILVTTLVETEFMLKNIFIFILPNYGSLTDNIYEIVDYVVRFTVPLEYPNSIVVINWPFITYVRYLHPLSLHLR